MSKNIPKYPKKKRNDCDSVLIQDIKNEKEELVLGCVKKGKKYCIYSLYTTEYYITCGIICNIIFRVRVPLQNDTPDIHTPHPSCCISIWLLKLIFHYSWGSPVQQ